MKNVLVAGFATRHVAHSAYMAGYRVYAVDHFCDTDLAEITDDCMVFDEVAELPSAIHQMCEKYKIDLTVVTSGAEDLCKLPMTVTGTCPEVAHLFLDKREMQHFFEGLGVPVPCLAEKGEFPAMLKPCRGSGGWRNRVVECEDDVRQWEEDWPDEPYLLQKLVRGVPTSVCCVTDGKRAVAVAVNRQIMRYESGNSREGGCMYGFSGSVTPFIHPLCDEMVETAELIAVKSGCKGIIGIDFMTDETEFHVIELNPRFQATLDTVEMATGLNLFNLHIDACNGIIPKSRPAYRCVTVRRIIFADRDIRINGDMKTISSGRNISDIPAPGTEFYEGHAVVSVYGHGNTYDAAYEMVEETISMCRSFMVDL